MPVSWDIRERCSTGMTRDSHTRMGTLQAARNRVGGQPWFSRRADGAVQQCEPAAGSSPPDGMAQTVGVSHRLSR